MPIEMPIFYLISDNDFTTIALPFSLLESWNYENNYKGFSSQCAEPDLNKTSNTLADTPTTFILMA